jgi:plastocyanin
MRLTVVAAAIGLVGLGAGCGGSDNSSSPTTTGAGAVLKTIAVSEADFALSPGSIRLDEPGTYVFHATNDGQVTHALELEGHGVEAETDHIAPGASADLRVEISDGGDYELYCPIGNHRDRGMKATVAVEGSSGGGKTTTTEGGAGLGY